MNGWLPKHVKMKNHKDTETHRQRPFQVHADENLDRYALLPQEGPPLTRWSSHCLPEPGGLGKGRAWGRGDRTLLTAGHHLCGSNWRITKKPFQGPWSCSPPNPLAEGSLPSSLICHRMCECVRGGGSASPFILFLCENIDKVVTNH